MKKLLLALLIASTLTSLANASQIQKQGIVNHASCSARSVADNVCLPDDNQVYINALGIDNTLNYAITNHLIGNTGFSPSYVWVLDGNGYGSTNTSVRRFTNIQFNVGSDITYADSATLGASFTINTTGQYAISYADANTGVSTTNFTATKNNTTYGVNTGMFNLAFGFGASGSAVSAAATVHLVSGDVIRPLTDGVANQTDDRCQFSIVRIQ